MIRCHIGRLMGERKLKVSDVARATGLNRNTITLLYREEARQIDLETLDRLCDLFACSIAELLEHTPPAEGDPAGKTDGEN